MKNVVRCGSLKNARVVQSAKCRSRSAARHRRVSDGLGVDPVQVHCRADSHVNRAYPCGLRVGQGPVHCGGDRSANCRRSPHTFVTEESLHFIIYSSSQHSLIDYIGVIVIKAQTSR